jgi:hypothetical protein
MEQRLLQKKNIRTSDHATTKEAKLKLTMVCKDLFIVMSPLGQALLSWSHKRRYQEGTRSFQPSSWLSSPTNHTNTPKPLTAHEGSRGISEEYSTTKEEDNHMSHHRQTGVSS